MSVYNSVGEIKIIGVIISFALAYLQIHPQVVSLSCHMSVYNSVGEIKIIGVIISFALAYLQIHPQVVSLILSYVCVHQCWRNQDYWCNN